MTQSQKDDLAVLTGMQLLFAHAVERCTTEIENLYYRNYITNSDYKKLCKAYGKAAADQILAEQCKKILRQTDSFQFNKIIAKAKELHQLMENCTEVGIRVSETDEMTAFSALQQDANDICKLYLLMAATPNNQTTDNQIIAYLRRKGKTNKYDELIKRFELK